MKQRFVLILSTVLCAGALASTAAAVSPSDLVSANYPRESLVLGEQGTVAFAVDLDEHARIESCVVTKSSGYPRLDAATCDLIVLHANFAPAEAEGGKRVATTRTGRIAWRLPAPYRANAARAPAPVQLSSAELERNRLFCRRMTKAGSLLKTTTHCLTAAEWSVAQNVMRQELEEFIKRTRNRV